MIPNDWRLLAGGDTTTIMVGVDFESGRMEPGFADLAPLLALPYSLVQPAPPIVSGVDGLGVRYVEAWVREVKDNDLDVRAVFGYCAGGSIACAMATELGLVGYRPAVVLLDPDEVSGSMLCYQFMLAVQQFGEFMNPDELASLIEAARAKCRGSDLTDPARWLVEEYRRVAQRALVDLGADDELVDELSQRFAQYVEYLLACWQVGYGTAEDDVLTILSEDYRLPAGVGGVVRRFPVNHLDILVSQPIATVAADTVRAVRSGCG